VQLKNRAKRFPSTDRFWGHGQRGGIERNLSSLAGFLRLRPVSILDAFALALWELVVNRVHVCVIRECVEDDQVDQGEEGIRQPRTFVEVDLARMLIGTWVPGKGRFSPRTR
jgi:hypothetical protein